MSELITNAESSQLVSGEPFEKRTQMSSTAAMPSHVLQIAKLLIIPFVCVVEKFWLGREFSTGVVTSVVTVVTGVAIV